MDINKHNLYISNFKTWLWPTLILLVKCLFIVFVWVFMTVNYVMPQYSYETTAGLIDKVERLKSIREPKIVLLGNSNVEFGIKSEMLEAEFGMPVVNMGEHATLGNTFLERLGKINLNSGDIIISCRYDYGDNGDRIGQDVLTWLALENHKELWKDIVEVKDIPILLKSFPIYYKKALALWSNGKGNMDDGSVYSRSAFNEYGDIAYERKKSQVSFKEGDVFVPPVTHSEIERVNELGDYITQKGATFLISVYPVAQGTVTPPQTDYEQFQKNIEEHLRYPMISNITDYFIPYEYFYDTVLHLTDEGAEIRTKQLISDLKQYLNIEESNQ